MPEKRVIPLESNPEIFTEMAHKLGLSPVLQFHDVLSLTEPDLLAFLPQPVYGITLLFPLTESYETYRVQKDALKPAYHNEQIKTIKWFQQTIGNACGLYGLLHILANLPSDFIINNLLINKFLLTQIDSSASIEDVNKLVETIEQQLQLDDNYGSQGQTEAPNPQDSVDLHFVSFVKGADNHLYELDGRRNGPIDLGPSTDGPNIIEDSNLQQKIQFYIDNTDDQNKHNFAMIAIGPSMD